MTRLTTPFGFDSTADDVAADVDLTSKHAIVTGATSGIGFETARVIASTGATVTLAVRDMAAGARAAREIVDSTGRDRVRIKHLDLAEPESIEMFAASWSDPLHVLVNNAGIMAPPVTHTAQGWEMHLVVNHLGHFHLALRLRDAMIADGNARVVAVSSSSHQVGPFDFDDPHFARRLYSPTAAYGQSKTANVLFAVEANTLWTRDGITANAAMPGAVPTNLQRFIGEMKVPPAQRKSVAQGAATPVLLAVSPLLEGVGGRYFADCNQALLLEDGERDITKVAPHALDPSSAARLWDLSLEMVGIG